MDVSVVVVDDHAVFREGLRTVLEGETGVSIVGEAGDVAEAIEAIELLRPDVVLMDLHLPSGSGVEVTRRVAANQPECAILVLTMLDDEASVVAAIRAGARGYLLKDSRLEDIVRAVQAVAAGQMVLGRDVAAFVTSGVGQSLDQSPDFTPRERQLVSLLARGSSTGEMAGILGISSKTVRNHLSNIYLKLGAQDRAQAVFILLGQSRAR